MAGQPAPNVSAEERSALVQRRIEALRSLSERHDASAIILDSRRDFAWLTLGGQNHIPYTTETGVAPVLVTREDAVVLAPINEHDRIAEEEVAGLPLRLESLPWWQPGAALERSKQIAKDGRLITAADVGQELTSLRSQLTAAEHSRMTWLAQVVLEVAQEALRDVRPSTVEDEIVARVSAGFAAQGVRLPVVLTASDERIERYRHPLPAPRAVHARVMLIVVAERWGLHVAHTQFRELREMDKAVEERAAKLGDVLTAMRTATIPGNTLGDVLDAARESYRAVGMEEQWTLHHQGGTIGYQAREQIATPGDQTAIVPGMAFAWNPSAVGFKREETLYLDQSGAQHVLTTTPD